jgi:hypothetical protein
VIFVRGSRARGSNGAPRLAPPRREDVPRRAACMHGASVLRLMLLLAAFVGLVLLVSLGRLLPLAVVYDCAGLTRSSARPYSVVRRR